MTLTTTDLLDDVVRADLDTVYGPGWTLAGYLEIMPGAPRCWQDTTRAARVAWRDRLAELWRRKGWMAV